MPELPEVESLRRSLEPHLIGRRLRGVDIHFPMLRWAVPQGALETMCQENPRLDKITRRGKYLGFHFNDQRVILSHLGMSGQWLVDEPYKPNHHMHIVLYLDDKRLTYRDPRRFGMIDVAMESELLAHPRLRELGPEPLSELFSVKTMWPNSRGAKTPIKTWLMNPKNVVGVGNIYASEALHLAGIRPTLRTNRLSKPRLSALIGHVKSVISQAIESGGTTLQDYRNAEGEVGQFQLRLKVYGREGQSCEQCGSEIRKVVIAQRSTFYCSVCQKF